MRIASIDIGTNTVRLLIGEISRDGFIRKLHIERVITRLGEGFTQNNRLIGEKAAERTIEALKQFGEVIKKFGVERSRAVATSVVRESSNGVEFKERAIHEAGNNIEIISGEEEAALTVNGVLKSVSVPTDDALVFDIGGGSTEFIHVRKGNVITLKSLPIGVVHLTETYLSNYINSQVELTVLAQHIDSIIESGLTEVDISGQNDVTLIATAGTPTTLAAIELKLDPYDPGRVNGFILTRDMIVHIVEKLSAMTLEERVSVPGLEKGREDLIIAGALTVLSALRRFSKDRLVVSDGGLLEGVLYSFGS
jgi:exopolyphosphatase/guanosine-5'-triphosphate,3'-diphosphate pyrophosphatase